MGFEKLNDENFVLFAAKHYDNPSCVGLDEFYDDLQRFKYLKRLFSKYKETGQLKERLVLNHLISLYNLFGVHTTRMLFFKLDSYWTELKPFVVLLGYMPERIESIGDHGVVISTNIPLDAVIVSKLREY